MLRALCGPDPLPARRYENWKQISICTRRTSLQKRQGAPAGARPMRQGEGNLEGNPEGDLK
jgi:hypothetical protein